ncbi:retinal rod rhodopsin-sensitive cGMP 3',5'-cyclic phosphodiesterase subunit delta-like [Panonychus citri]|uniref:retinal rod rhodopsin-sensitive cGMP 3',5'-cyclic phosphodiesterase subunit delta-like n=1 Tax=Panonychus citri TaxID=50023 RepID=UPI0023081A8D|nr:retinal rod rhodopsin-sensitive cGMP 3',5'-cyclic phosphodiesterase subunit delta-like [Panonychus citri]
MVTTRKQRKSVRHHPYDPNQSDIVNMSETSAGDEVKQEKDKAQILAEGFKLYKISLRDPESKRILWSTKEDITKSKEEFKVTLTKDVYDRTNDLLMEIVFSSAEPMENFNLKKRILFKNKCLEEWFLEFGEVKEKSAYTWQVVLSSSPNVTNMPFEALSGLTTIETKFFDQDVEFHSGTMKIFYEEISSE